MAAQLLHDLQYVLSVKVNSYLAKPQVPSQLIFFLKSTGRQTSVSLSFPLSFCEMIKIKKVFLFVGEGMVVTLAKDALQPTPPLSASSLLH